MQTREQLNTERTNLIAKLDYKSPDTVLEQLRENEAKIKELNKIELLNNVNGNYNRIRAFALQAWECEQPTEDITTNDGGFHKTKVKKYPNIATLKYASATWKDEKLTVINVNGHKFSMFKIKYENGKPDTYTRPDTFNDFLALNNIPFAEITLTEYTELSEKVKALNNELEANIEQYKKGLEALNHYQYSCWGLINQQPTHLYKYTPNK